MVAIAEVGPEHRLHLTFSVKLLAMATAFGLALLAFQGWYIRSSSLLIASAQSLQFRSVEATAMARSSNENRKTAVRMAAATLDLRWRERYLSSKAVWQSSLAEVRRLAPADFRSEASQGVTESLARLLGLEDQCF